jgi:membrane-associated phospholipid phosphatase
VTAFGRIARVEGGLAGSVQQAGASRARSGASAHARWCVVAFAGLGLVTAQAPESWLGRLDRVVISMIQNRRSPAAVAVARAVSALAEPGFAVLPLAAAAAIALRRAGGRAACTPCLAVASGVVARRRLSRAIARPRPPAGLWLTEPEGFSLPSKHTSLAGLTVGACASAVGAGSLASHAASLLAAAGVGAGRVYLGVHWPSDVLAGWLFAAGWLHLAESVLTAPAHARRPYGSGPGAKRRRCSPWACLTG